MLRLSVFPFHRLREPPQGRMADRLPGVRCTCVQTHTRTHTHRKEIKWFPQGPQRELPPKGSSHLNVFSRSLPIWHELSRTRPPRHAHRPPYPRGAEQTWTRAWQQCTRLSHPSTASAPNLYPQPMLRRQPHSRSPTMPAATPGPSASGQHAGSPPPPVGSEGGPEGMRSSHHDALHIT